MSFPFPTDFNLQHLVPEISIHPNGAKGIAGNACRSKTGGVVGGKTCRVSVLGRLQDGPLLLLLLLLLLVALNRVVGHRVTHKWRPIHG